MTDQAMSYEQALEWIKAACQGDKTTLLAFHRIRRELAVFRKIVDLCKEEIEHGFDLPSEVFDLTEAYWQTYRAPKDCPCDERLVRRMEGEG